MAISSSNQTKLNRMNRAAANVSLGSLLANLQTGSAVLNSFIRASGSVTVTAAHASASSVVILTGLTGIKGQLVQIYNTTGSLKSETLNVTHSGSAILVNSGSVAPWAVGLNDAINWIVW